MTNRLTRNIKIYWGRQKAIRYRNYRLFLVGQCLSLIGTWIQRLAMIWLVYQLTNSAFLLGVVGFCEQVPIFLIAPFAGVFADRWDKHKALKYIEMLALLQALLLGFLTIFNLIQVWQIILLSLCLGTINAFEVPMRQSFVLDMVNRDKAAMTNAIALNSTVFNLSRLIGPSVAGILISFIGEGACFMTNAASYAAVLISLFMMRIDVVPQYIASGEAVMKKMKEGFVYIFRHISMRSLLLLLATVSLFTGSIKALAPIFSKEILGGGAKTLGLLMTAIGVGAIMGAFYLTNRHSAKKLNRLVGYTAVLVGVGLLLFAISGNLWLSLFFLLITGFSRMLTIASCNTILQLLTEDDKRGRVMSFYTMATQGMQPFGSLLAGSLASAFGAVWAVGSMGVACMIGGGLYMRNNKRVRQLIQKHGSSTVKEADNELAEAIHLSETKETKDHLTK